MRFPRATHLLVHCKSDRQAGWIKSVIESRLAECQLELHPEKTKIVYCKDQIRRGNYPNEKFDFLGFTFRARTAVGRNGTFFVSFLPAVSDQAVKSIRAKIKSSRLIAYSTPQAVQPMGSTSFIEIATSLLKDLAGILNPQIQGWINYYGRFYKSALSPIFKQLNRSLQRWAMRKYKKLRGRKRRAYHWLGHIAKQMRYLFAHWRLGVTPSAGR